ncbi:tail fiber domain-containing protein [Shimia aestuarii]|uniref:tail fiber domain-containing protein n=1 Tax=Shimia aestuarii TaxID=254406 RepID=UPI001FB292B5|nr:tail fiber domain-containing protein [Shimia aestuarii]
MRHTAIATLLITSLTATTALAGPPATAFGTPTVSSQSVADDAASASTPAIAIVGLLALTMALLATSSSPAPLPAPSDERLKTDIDRVGTAANGLPLYHFRYKGHPQVFEGVMAQDVLAHTPDAVLTMPGGYLAVDYGMLGLSMTRVD